MSEYYKLYLNSNDKKYCLFYDFYDCKLENVILKEREVVREKMGFFGIKKTVEKQEYLEDAVVIAEKKDRNKMIDLVTGMEIVFSGDYETNEMNFRIPVSKKNYNSKELSYYKAEKISTKEVVEQLKEYKDDDIKRYTEKLLLIKELSLKNYYKNIEDQEKKKQEEEESQLYINNFAKKYRK